MILRDINAVKSNTHRLAVGVAYAVRLCFFIQDINNRTPWDK